MFPETLRKLRKSRKLNQAQLAKKLYISPSAVSQYETGRTTPSRETLNRIAAYFNVSPEYLMGASKKYTRLRKCLIRNIILAPQYPRC